jgi:mRNA interferase RelE/StbE
MAYGIRWSEASLKQIGKLDKETGKRIFDKVEFISEDPFSHVKKLTGFDLYTLRIGSYRALMSIENNKMVIFVLEVGHRSSVYRKY